MNRALLGAAATALTVKGALTGPLGAAAQAPLNDTKERLGKVDAAAMTTSSRVVENALATLSELISGMAGGDLPSPSRPSSLRAPTAIPPPPTEAAASPSSQTGLAETPNHPTRTSEAFVRNILHDAAVRHGLDPKLVLALSYWESGWDQERVSGAGAVGVMQVEPDTASEAGPALLGRSVDLTDLYDNADVGAAVFRQYLDAFGDPAQALAAYDQGPTSLRANGMFPDTRAYVEGILDLAARMSPDGTVSQ